MCRDQRCRSAMDRLQVSGPARLNLGAWDVSDVCVPKSFTLLGMQEDVGVFTTTTTTGFHQSMEVAQPIAGPSRLPQVAQKPRSARAGRPAYLDNRTKFPPPLPASRASSHPATRANGQLPTLPIKVLQGQSTRRTDATKPGYSRDMVFVTRRTSLGSLMSRCRSLLVDEG